MTHCPDFKECHLARQGLPPCKNSCSVRQAMSDPQQWAWIKHFADDGNDACAETIGRGEGKYLDLALPPRIELHRSGKSFYRMPIHLAARTQPK